MPFIKEYVHMMLDGYFHIMETTPSGGYVNSMLTPMSNRRNADKAVKLLNNRERAKQNNQPASFISGR
jgi:hypothetical protein